MPDQPGRPGGALRLRLTGKGAAIKSIMVLWIGSLGGGLLAFLNQVAQARVLGPADYGTFAAALGMVTLVSPLASFGVGGLWLRLFGLEGWGARRWLGVSLRYALISTALVLIATLVWAAAGPHDPQTRRAIAILSLFILGQASLELVSSLLQLEGKYRQLAAWQFMPHLLRLLLLGALILAARALVTPDAVAIIYSSIGAAMAVFGAVMIRRIAGDGFGLVGHGPAPDGPRPKAGATMREVVAQAWPFGVGSVFYLIYFQSDIVLLKYMRGDEAAGIYSVAATVMAAAYMLPAVVYQKFLLPKLHRWAVHDRARFRRAYDTGNRIMIGLGVATMAALMLAADIAVPLLFGRSYDSSIHVLYVLAISAPLRFLSTSIGAALVTHDYMRRKVVFMAIAASANVILNVGSVPTYGVMGAAVSTLMSEALLAMLYFIGARSYFQRNMDGV